MIFAWNFSTQCAFQDNNARVRYSFYSFRISSWSDRALRVASDLRSFQDGRMALEAVDTFVITLELVYRELIAREQLDGCNADVAEACDFVTQSL